jgi:FemAB-related protein (PEP-CTERM system-associated)
MPRNGQELYQDTKNTLVPHQIKYAGESDRELWDRYVQRHPDASLYHLFGWRNVIHETYGHATYYLMLMSHGGELDNPPQRSVRGKGSGGAILGVLPLVHLRNILFGNCLVSLPFVDGGGILSDGREGEEILLAEAIRLGREVGADTIELHHERLLASCSDLGVFINKSAQNQLSVATRANKVRMLLALPESAGALMSTFKSTVRNRIKKALNEGFTSRTGGVELLKDFYRVLAVNMRDLGSPVHSVRLMRKVFEEFPDQARLIVIYRQKEPVASGLLLGMHETLRNPWVSSLKKYAPLSPNMLLYLRMCEFACDHGYQAIDLGRSSPGEGTYIFKEKWGAAPAPLYWHYISLDGKSPSPEGEPKEKFRAAMQLWKKLPVVVTKIIGPSIRKHISL